MRTIFYATTAIALIAAAVACSDNNNKGDAGPGAQVCPTTIEAATKTASGSEGTNDSCHVDRYICVVGFQCGNFTQQATCTCTIPTGETALRFQCFLADGTEVQKDTTDSTGLCNQLKPDASSDPCPTDKTKADGTPCNTSGEVCTYSTTCTTQPPPQDTCQCKGNISGNPGLSWACELNQCP